MCIARYNSKCNSTKGMIQWLSNIFIELNNNI